MNRSTLDRFLDKVYPDPNTGCWLWTGSLTANGYGQFHVAGRVVRAHRWSYEHHVGPIPDGLELDHLCRVRACVNFVDLEPVTKLVNVRRGEGGAWQLAKTHCPQGHPYDDANTYVQPDGHGRMCRICRSDAVRRCRAKKKS